MSGGDLLIVCIIGGIFLILGILVFLWGKSEEKSWYSSISTRVDVREFLDRLPIRPEPGALKIGGRICMTIGIIMLLAGLGFYFWG